MADTEFPYGPFVHGINKGGLTSIVRMSMLRSSEARTTAGGAGAVRAHRGSFNDLQKRWNWSGQEYSEKPFLEFYTRTPPVFDPAYALWPMDEGSYLPIKISGLYYGSGRRVDLGNLAAKYI